MRHALDAIASLLTDKRCDALTLDWAKLRYSHTAAVRLMVWFIEAKLPGVFQNKCIVFLD
jgi:hypothetical protein